MNYICLIKLIKTNTMANLSKHIWEGWTVQDFIDGTSIELEMMQAGKSCMKKLESKAELKAWLKSNQPYYKKTIPEVVNYYAKKYNLK